jgi:Raf kinase inhibitor-like YbhB/YbcL family protein
MTLRLGIVALGVLPLLSACGSDDEPDPESPAGGSTSDTPQAHPFTLESPAFGDGLAIPTRFSCEGANISPALSWSEPPAPTKSFALIMDDPAALRGTFTHWLLFDLPPETRGLPEAVEASGEPPAGGVQGENGAGDLGYTGPCPPPGSPHEYVFTVYPLDTELDLDDGASKSEVLDAAQGHILAQGQ